MDNYRKRPRLSDDQQQQPPTSSRSTSNMTSSSTSSSSSCSPTIQLLQTELRTLRAELTHSQSLRSIERTNASRSETRYKRQLADAYEEITQCNELIDSLRERVDKHSEVMEGSRLEWLERIQWYEDRFNTNGGRRRRRRRRRRDDEHDSYSDDDDEDSSTEEDEDDDEEEGGLSSVSRNKYNLLQQRLDATWNQVHELEQALGEANEFRIAAEQRATELRCTPNKKKEEVADENKAPVEIPRDLRIKVAETERANRELHRQNEALKDRCQDMIQHKERAASLQRKVKQLEKDVQLLTQEVEEGKEAQSRWMRFRYDIVGEIGGEENEDGQEDIDTMGLSSVPPEISTVIRKFRTLKQTAKRHEDEVARITQLSDAHLRRCKVLETQLNEKSQSISLLEKTVNDQEIATNQLELENRKIVAQQNIWKREVEGMRSLLDTYEQQETMQAKKKSNTKPSGNADGLQLSLNSARDEIKLLSETNDKLESTIEELRTEQQTAKVEHERVLDKFYKLRNALMDERSKAEAAEVRANHAETLAGKGSYNSETTRVLHLKDNPLMDAIKDKYQAEIDSLQRRLDEAEGGKINTTSQETTTTTPATSKATRGSFGSAGSRDSASAVDVQKLHSRLKEQFRNQIALFRQGVYLITGFKIDMSPKSSSGDNDVQIFTVRSVYGEREDDHIMFQWSPKKKSKLDMLNTDMAHLLMKGPSGVYVKEHGSWPGFMASVTLQLFDQQTVL